MIEFKRKGLRKNDPHLGGERGAVTLPAQSYESQNNHEI